MYFASDNAGPAHPAILDALTAANTGYAPGYGADDLMEEVRARIRDAFEAPDAAVYLVATGTAANALILATFAQPWQAIFCARASHIQEDECGAPEFYTGGGRLSLVDGPDGKMDPAALRRAILGEEIRGVHGVQRGPLSVTQVTETGTVYTLPELRELCGIAKNYNLPVHMDGARFSNALASLGCSPAEMSWKAGVDAVSFGGTKNGLLGVEAVVIFDPEKAWEFELRRKRGGHLFSKHRYLSAQMAAYLRDDLWMSLAGAANAAASDLTAGLRRTGLAELVYPVDANMLFVRLPRRVHRHLMDNGAKYYLWDGDLDGANPDEMLTARLVCDWSAREDDRARFLDLVQDAAQPA